MTILICNIGTSDLAVKVDGYYLPIGFDRIQPNMNYSELSEEEKDYWDNLQFYITETICQPLKVEVKEESRGEKKFYRYSFRDLTKAILDNYDDWKDRVKPCRILGVIDKAVKEFQVKNIYFFVTNQKSLHPQDSIYLFKILEKWLKENDYDVNLFAKYIPEEIVLNNESLDRLLDFYYSFFQELIHTYDGNEQLLVSLKGGIPNMQTALKMQTISAPMSKQLFLNPQLSLKNVLSGKNSDCELTSFWQYTRSQKYNTVKQLLNRWDFDGCTEILNDWNKTLTFFIEQEVLQKSLIKQNRRTTELVKSVLKAGLSAFNLDISSSRNIIKSALENTPPQLVNNLSDIQSQLEESNYDNLLNIYTQCCIYDELGQTANMLSSMMSFYDIMLQKMIKIIGGKQYLTSLYHIKLEHFKNDIGNELFSQFKDLEKNVYGKYHNIKFNRFSKVNYINILVKHRSQNLKITNQINYWNEIEYQLQDNNTAKGILGLLESLEYWADFRNKTVHHAEGISPARLTEANQNRPDGACSYDEILWIIEQILTSPLIASKRDYKKDFVATEKYYIYSDIKKWAIDTLIY